MEPPEKSEKVRELIDQLGRAFAHAIMTDEAGQELLRQIQETGFDVGILLEATVALHSKNAEDDYDSPKGCHFYDSGSERLELPEQDGPLENKPFDWSEEDRALLCNFRISLD